MVWLPRRHRTLVYKLLVLIPVAWLTIAFLLYNGNNSHIAPHAEARVGNTGVRGEGGHGNENVNNPPAQPLDLIPSNDQEIVISPAAIAQKPPETEDR